MSSSVTSKKVQPNYSFSTSFIANKVIAITGPTNGIGKAFVYRLINEKKQENKPRKIIIISRNAEKLEKLRNDIVTTGGMECTVYVCDCGVQKEVLQICDEIMQKENQLDCLVSNHGTFCPKSKKQVVKGDDPYEIHYSVNFLSSALIISALRPLLEKSSIDNVKSRIVVVGSFTAQMQWNPDTCCTIRVDDMNFDKRGGNVNGCFCCPPCFPPCMGFPGWNGYMSSKMSNHLWSKHYAENIIDNNKLNLLVKMLKCLLSK